MVGRTALLWCKTPLFGACCATIVQPDGYNGLKYADVFAHHDVSNPPIGTPPLARGSG
jgi:hypothetical protein